jgi:catechol 2,3-dioxygenase-like lactoylglutathione lyase family enzyme
VVQQQISVVTLGVADLQRSGRFYRDGFEWTPIFQNDDIHFYQMNGFVLGTWLRAKLEDDMRRSSQAGSGAVALAHNVASGEAVEALLEKLVAAGGRMLRPADAPEHGGLRGYVADPDGHAWEIAWNPSFTIDAEGRVAFGL